MNHDIFGEIAYQTDDQHWLGRWRLLAFAEYGVEAGGALAEPDADFRQGFFSLTIQDMMGNGPSPEQANIFRFVRQNEPEVCQAVMLALLGGYRSLVGPSLEWANRRRNSWLWGWLARWLLHGEYRNVEDLKRAVRCTGVELSYQRLGDSAYAAFHFDTSLGLDPEHGVSVVFHPTQGASLGDASAIHYIQRADHMDDE
jgi:hypothetical protein